MIPAIDAVDLPHEVIDWCTEHDYSTHYHSSIAAIEDDGNPLAEWLKVNGFVFPENGFAYVAIHAT